MEDAAEDPDTGATATVSTALSSDHVEVGRDESGDGAAPEQHPRVKNISHSQPLGPDAALVGTGVGSSAGSRRASFRKHSLDDTVFGSVAPYPVFFSSPPPSFPHHQHHPHLEHRLSEPQNDIRFHAPPMPRHRQHRGNSGCTDSSSFCDSDGSMTLERALTEYGGTSGTLPEFVASGGGKGIFKVPLRAAMHPERPPSLELRPHPIRETQAGRFLRTIVCEPRRDGGGQLWAGTESGIRVWQLDEVFAGWHGGMGSARRGDEESAPFSESAETSPVMCLVLDAASGLIWSGHKDGKIRSWRMDLFGGNDSSEREDGDFAGESDDARFKEGFSWQAHHRSPVLSMVITSYGDIWSGSEGGAIKAWPWDAIHKSLSLTKKEIHMAALLVERAYVDIRNQVTVGGVCSLPAADVRFMVADMCKAKVWSATSMTFAIWDAQSRDLLKVFGIDGQLDIRMMDALPVQETTEEDEMKIKFVSASKKEKSQGPINFLQRSRNALMGAADAVRRVATKGTLVEDNRRTGALGIAKDGVIWSGCTNGSLLQWDGNGNRVQEFQHHTSSVQCICSYGNRVWVSYASGTVQVMDLEGNLLGGWTAHSCPVIKMDVAGPYIFTLAHHGGIRGWHLKSPGPLDDILRTEIANRELSYTKKENIQILVGTWNVGQEKASHDALISWLGSAASDVGLIVVGLQEVEMGAGFLAMAAAKETDLRVVQMDNGGWRILGKRWMKALLSSELVLGN